MKASENLNNVNKYKFNMRILIGAITILLIITTLYMVFADSSVVPIITEENGVPYMYFELEHSLSNAQYKYYGYGYTVSVYEPGPNGALLATKYIQNAQFRPYMDGSTEKVWIPMQEIYGMVNLDDEFYSVRNMKVYLNGRLGIKVNGKLTYLYDSHEGESENGLKETGLQTGYWKEDGLTVSLNKDGQGIANGIKFVYGVSWTPITYTNLRQHFGIPLTVPAIYKYDRYRVEYREISSKKTVNSGKPYQNFEDTATITEHPVLVNGYEYSGQYMIEKIDTDNNEVDADPYGDTQEGDSATINIKKKADRYIITFYYTKIDSTTIGKPVTVNVEYREDVFNGKELLNSTTTIGGDLSQFNFSSEKIDDYTCIGYYVIGQSSEYFHDTNVSFVIGKEDYSKPVDGRLKIIFIYEKIPYVSIPKCSPSVDGKDQIVNITMKKKDFENATDVSINNVTFGIEDFKCGKDKDGKTVTGEHKFSYFDLYIEGFNSSFDNKSKDITQSLIIPKSKFVQSSDNSYTTDIGLTYAAFCKCFDGKSDKHGNYGMATCDRNLRVNITLLANKPPMAFYTYYARKIVNKEIMGAIENKAYINQETIIKNMSSDPNGILDISYIKYKLKDSNKKEYYVKLLMLQNKTYFLENENVSANNIQFNGVTEDGNLRVVFKTSETWTISQYIEDLDGLNDLYSRNITPEELKLEPTAILADTLKYRYPVTNSFNGKQNRVVEFNSNNSYVAEYFTGTTVSINHNRDNWEIVPMDGQSIDSVKFANDLTYYVIDNVIQGKYIHLNNVKMMFKENGKYKIRLQVTDTQGNISEWAEKIITINNDIEPTVTASIANKIYRNSTGYATIKLSNIVPKSLDGDVAMLESITYKYDTNNNGSFDDESSKPLDINSNLITKDLGKYQLEITVKESFGQQTIQKYIADHDYKRGTILLNTEVDNIAPNISIFKIMTTEE